MSVHIHITQPKRMHFRNVYKTSKYATAKLYCKCIVRSLNIRKSVQHSTLMCYIARSNPDSDGIYIPKMEHRLQSKCVYFTLKMPIWFLIAFVRASVRWLNLYVRFLSSSSSLSNAHLKLSE